MCKSDSHFFSGTTGHKQAQGTLKGSLNGLTQDERDVISELLEENNNIEIIPRSPISKTPDILVNGVSVEIKHVHSRNTNTGTKRIRKGFMKNPQKVLLDGRPGMITHKDADIIIDRIKGTCPGNKLPIPVEIRTIEGNFIYE